MAEELEAIIHESDHVNQSIQRIYNGMYTAFGVVLPGLIGIFVFAVKESTGNINRPAIGFAFIAALSLGSLWVHNLWMELFSFVRYRYLILQQRLYAASDQGGRMNFLEYSSPRSVSSWSPIMLLNFLSFILLLCVWISLFNCWSVWQRWISLAFIAAPVISAFFVVSAARAIEQEIIKSRDNLETACGRSDAASSHS